MAQEAHDISSFVHKMNSESSPAMSFILFYLAYGVFVGMLENWSSLKDVSQRDGTRAGKTWEKYFNL